LVKSAQQLDEFVAGELGVAEDLAHESWANGFAGMHRHHSSSSVRMLKKVMTSLDADYLKGTLSQGPHDRNLSGEAGDSRCNGNSLDANKRHGLELFAFDFQAEFDCFLHPLHKLVQGAGLGMTASERRNGRYIVAR
jgi:hypothetical protein